MQTNRCDLLFEGNFCFSSIYLKLVSIWTTCEFDHSASGSICVFTVWKLWLMCLSKWEKMASLGKHSYGMLCVTWSSLSLGIVLYFTACFCACWSCCPSPCDAATICARHSAWSSAQIISFCLSRPENQFPHSLRAQLILSADSKQASTTKRTSYIDISPPFLSRYLGQTVNSRGCLTIYRQTRSVLVFKKLKDINTFWSKTSSYVFLWKERVCLW